jgi:hypothetical protein
MYDKQLDFTVTFKNEDKRYFDVPRYELYVFFDTDCGRWYYELVDHNAFSLADFNNGCGKLFKTSLTWCQSEIVEKILQQRYPNSIIEFYENIQTWLADRESGCWK